MTLLLLPLALLAADTPPGKGEPPLTAQTKRSGGTIDPEQAKLRFDAADLQIELLPASKSITGVATLNFTARAPLSELRIDLDRNLPVSAVTVDGAALPPGEWTNPDGRLRITLPRQVAAGRAFTTRITYGGTPHVAVRPPWDDGVVWSSAAGETWFATTAQGYGCDLFWPCLDFPTAEPAVVTLHLTVPAGLKAPSNGKLLGVDRLSGGRTRWNWRVRNPNTYGVALNVGPYKELSAPYRSRYDNTVPLHFWYLPAHAAQARGLFAEFAPTLDFFEAVIGPYPFADEKLGVVETPHLGMEHQTINAYGNEYKKAVEGFDWLFHHELSHEWFANQLTAANWDDFWLHEGFATYMQPLYGRWREGEARYAAMMDLQRQRILNDAPIVSGRVRTSEEVYETGKGGPGSDIYFKASWMLHTLRGLIGDKAFFDATRRLVYGRPDPKPGNFRPRFGTTREFEGYVRDATGRDHAWFFDVYLRQAKLPELVERRDGETLLLEWRVPGGGAFPMPVEIQVGGQLKRVAMAGGRGTLAVPEGAHVVIDPNARILRRSAAVEAIRGGR
ncbi:M1 family metallopeptidase [uncultured Sphingomonas sp.]|uniref:M1 family metallopeptidase n=1 Tax=uncultured Sphingomonas sp. TaxID=158754 RepID=UPI0035CC7368